MERVPGECMNNIDAIDLRDKVRSSILKQVITAETGIYDAGVEHRDFCPHNIVILGLCDIQVEVRVIDFNIAAVITHPQYVDRTVLGALKQRKKKWPMKMRSPIVMRFGYMMDFST
jgi:RIO-like serine/threonine protein kinase